MKVKTIKRIVYLIVIALIVFETATYVSYAAHKSESSVDKKRIVMYPDRNILQEEDLSTEERDTLDLINEYRAQNGLKKLKPYVKLQEIAKAKAEDLLCNEYFAHNSDKLGTPFQMLAANGIVYNVAGENLAGNINKEKAVEAWINSESHRANILEEMYEYTGIYIVDSEVYGKIFVQLFIG